MTTTDPGSGGTVQDMVYGYDNDGNITSITDNVDPDRSQQFTYDGLNRLVSANSSAYSAISVSYDAVGNITSNSRVGSYAYNGAGPHAVTSAGTNSYAYDADGNMTTRNTSGSGQVLTYDYDNRVSSITTGAVTTSFVYDFQGAKAYAFRAPRGTPSGLLTIDIGDFSGMLCIELYAGVEKLTNAPPSTTIYIGNLLKITDGLATENIFAGNRMIASRMGSDIYYYHPDHPGGLRQSHSSHRAVALFLRLYGHKSGRSEQIILALITGPFDFRRNANLHVSNRSAVQTAARRPGFHGGGMPVGPAHRVELHGVAAVQNGSG